MYVQLIWLVIVVASLNGAPAPDANPLLAQQYVVFTGPQQPAQHSYQYEPLVKLQQPLFQQITPLGRLETPQKQQLLVLYPNGPLTQYPLLSLRQDGGPPGGDFWQNIQNFFQTIGSGLGVPEPPPTIAPAGQPDGGGATKLDAPESPLKSAAPEIANPIAAAAYSSQQSLPASTQLLADRRFYILSDQPQFFGKYNAIPAPLNSVFHLQPLQAIQARSAEPLAQPEAIATSALYNAPQPIAAPEFNEQYDSNIPADGAPFLQSRSGVALEVEPLPESEQKAEPLPNQDDEIKETNRALPTPDDDETPSESSRNVDEGRATSDTETQEQSVAQASPTGIALAGKGGVASAKPIATSVVGDNGLALAAPTATAISGDFSEEDDRKKVDASSFE